MSQIIQRMSVFLANVQVGSLKVCFCTGWKFVFTNALAKVTVFSRSAQFNSRWYLCTGKAHVRSNSFVKCFLRWNSSTVGLTDDGIFSPSQGRSSRSSSFHTSLLQAIDGTMSFALRPQARSQTPQHLRSSEKQVTCGGCSSGSVRLARGYTESLNYEAKPGRAQSTERYMN